MSSVFIHESAIRRRKDFSFQSVNVQRPAGWSPEHEAGGIVQDFSKMLLRLESTNHCNFSCTFCPHPTMERPKGFMSEDLILSLIGEAGEMGFKMLDLRNFGEPLMDKRLSGFAEQARDSGFSKIYIHTNGHPLRAAKLDEWGKAGITDVNISLSPMREFAETRPGVNVDKFFKNLEKLSAENPTHMSILSADYIRTGFSSDEEEKDFLDWLGKVGIPLRTKIELHNWAVGEDTSHYACHRLWSSVTVLWDGRVALCCLDYEGDYELGNMNESSLSDLVNNELYVSIRKNHLEGMFLSKCFSCDMPKQKDVDPFNNEEI